MDPTEPVWRGDAAPLLFIGDLTYSEELMERDEVPATGDHAALMGSFAKVRALKRQLPIS